MEASNRILRVKEVAALTGAPEGTIRYWDSIGKGPNSFKMGGRRVWREGAVLAWIAEQEASTGRSPAA